MRVRNGGERPFAQAKRRSRFLCYIRDGRMSVYLVNDLMALGSSSCTSNTV